MLRLHEIFASTFLLLFGLLFLFVSALSYYGIRQIELQNYTKELRTALILLDNPQDLKAIDKKIATRVTLIAPDGRVIAESRFDKSRMENHLYRPEIQQAKRQGWGSSVRYSKTLHQNFLYVARRLHDGRFLRLAKPLQEIQHHFITLWVRFIGIFGLLLVVALVVSYIISWRIKSEVQKLIDYLEGIAKKEYLQKIESSFAKEFEILSNHLKKLAKRLKKREEKKERYTQKLKQISRQRTELISAISHEFKNPVAIINGYAQTLLEEEMTPSMRKKFLRKIYEASNKINYMIDRLALAMKFESESLKPQKQIFDICKVIEEAVEFIKQRYSKRKIDVVCESYALFADRYMIQTVISNLLDNALKYSEDEVRVEVRNGIVAVIDRGIGVRSEEITKLTKKFYRVRHSWDNSMGLGLYISEYILQLHGSRLDIESTFGQGSVFSFSLTPMKNPQ